MDPKKNNDGPPEMRLLTFKHAAQLCRCSEESLHRAVADGLLLTVPGGDGRESDQIREADLMAYRVRLKLADLARHTTDGDSD